MGTSGISHKKVLSPHCHLREARKESLVSVLFFISTRRPRNSWTSLLRSQRDCALWADEMSRKEEGFVKESGNCVEKLFFTSKSSARLNNKGVSSSLSSHLLYAKLNFYALSGRVLILIALWNGEGCMPTYFFTRVVKKHFPCLVVINGAVWWWYYYWGHIWPCGKWGSLPGSSGGEGLRRRRRRRGGGK